MKTPDNVMEYIKKLGRIGGKKTLAKYGNDHFKKMAQKGLKLRWDAYRKKKAGNTEK